MRFLFLCWIGCLFINNSIDGQTNIQYGLPGVPSELQEMLPKSILIKNQQQTFTAILNTCHNQGYIAASLDKIVWNTSKDTCTIELYTGKQYTHIRLYQHQIDPTIWNLTFEKDSVVEISFKDWATAKKRWLEHFENNGLPFAAIQLSDIQIKTDWISATPHIEKGPEIRWKLLELTPPKNGKLNLSRRYLARYLGLSPDKYYNEKNVREINRRLQTLPYIAPFRDYFISFTDGKATPYLFLKNRPSNRVDLLIGLLPNDNPIPGRPRFNITGMAGIDLRNPFGTGKRIKLAWQNLQIGRTQLEALFHYPYILNTPIGAQAQLRMYKQDSTYIDLISEVSLQYLFSGNNYVEFFWKNFGTRLLTFNNDQLLSTKTLPAILDTRRNIFGMAYAYQKLDAPINPRKGFQTHISASIGLKTILPNLQITTLVHPNDISFNFQSLYDSLDLKSQQYQFTIQHDHFIKLWKWSTFRTAFRGEATISSTPLLQNELYQIGGHQLLRGFDENSILAAWYGVLTLEWRFLFGQYSYAYAFGDIGYLERELEERWSTDWPIGFGIGVAFGIKSGVFSLSYALGREQNNPLLIQNAKIHFGFISVF